MKNWETKIMGREEGLINDKIETKGEGIKMKERCAE